MKTLNRLATRLGKGLSEQDHVAVDVIRPARPSPEPERLRLFRPENPFHLIPFISTCFHLIPLRFQRNTLSFSTFEKPQTKTRRRENFSSEILDRRHLSATIISRDRPGRKMLLYGPWGATYFRRVITNGKTAQVARCATERCASLFARPFNR